MQLTTGSHNDAKLTFVRPLSLLIALIAAAVAPQTLAAQQLNPIAPLSFTMPLNGNAPLPQVLEVTSNTGAQLDFGATASTINGGAWLSVSPGGLQGTPTSLTVTVNSNIVKTLAAGSYSGTITITPTNSSPIVAIPVSLTIAAPASSFFDNLPGGLTFSLETNGLAVSQVFEVRNGGSGTLAWSVVGFTTDGGNWLSITPSSGTAPSLVQVVVNPQKLPSGGALAGLFTGQLRFSSSNGSVSVPITVSVGGTNLVQINPLSFTMPLHGQAPLPQVIEATSNSGTHFDFGAVAYTATGGDWLTVGPGGLQGTPLPLTVGIVQSVVQTLPAGSYTGQVVITPTTGEPAIIIPVTLLVAPPTVPFFDNLPGSLTFSVQANSGNPVSQQIQIRNAGTGTLNWTVTPTTADGGNWLTISPTSGTAPSNLTVGVVSQNLPNGGQLAGIYTGNLLFQEVGTTMTVSVPITVSVGGTNLVQINPLSFTMPLHGQAPLPQVIEATSNSGTHFNFGAVAYTATGGDWLTVGPGGLQGTPLPLTVGIVQSVVQTLPAGTYTGQVVITPTTGEPAIVVPVILLVAPPTVPFFDNLPGSLNFSVQANGSNPVSQQIQIRNAGTGTLNWTVTPTTADGGNWLTISPTSGTAPSNLTVGVVSQNLPNGGQLAGIYTGNLLFQEVGTTMTVSVPITVSVGGTNLVQINPLSFTMPLHGQAPLPQVIEATSNSGTHFNFGAVAYTATGGDWLTVGPGGLQGTPLPLTVGIVQSVVQTLPAGTYTGQVVITPTTGEPAIVVPVTLLVALPTVPLFDNLPGGLNFSVQTNGGNPVSQQIQIRNAGSGTLNWTVTPTTADGGNWLTISPLSGTAPSNLTVGVVAQNLPGSGQIAGIYTGNLLFQEVGTTMTISVPITISVGGTNLVQINPLSFTMPLHGRAPLPQVIEATSNSGTHFDFGAVAYTATGGDWLTVGPGGLQGTPLPLTVGIVQSVVQTLPAGIYTGQVVVTPTTGEPAIVVPVTLLVAPPTVPFFDNLQGELYFSALPSNTPANQTVQIRNEGAGQLSWTLIPSTADGGNWLTVSALSGSAPSTITIGVVTQNLPNNGTLTATYTGQLLFESASGNITVPITVDIGSNVFVQSNGLTFNVPSGATSQTVSIASLGSAFDFSPDSFTGNGGNWLSVSPGGLQRTPQTETFTVNATGLASGSYTGEAIFQSGTVAQVIQVILNVGGGTTVSSITATSGTPQAAPTNSAFATPFVATVRDANNNPLANQMVTFTAPGSGASGTFAGQITASVTTNASGQAMAPTFMANSVAGSYSVLATVSGVSASAAFSLTNTAPALKSISITAATSSLVKGNTDQFTATGTYADGSTANITGQVSWISSNPAVVTINSSGLATGVAVGSANITASLSGITSNIIALSVTQPALQSIAITATTSSVVEGNTDQFTATGTYADGSTANITGHVSWNSSNPAVAIISASGLATGVAIGSTNITASLGGITSNSVALSVTQPALQSIAISAATSSLAKGNTNQFTAIGTYADGSTANITSQVSWSSSNPAVVIINSSGLATGVAIGTANITASLGGITSNSVMLSVTQPALQSIAIGAASSSLMKGSTDQFTATGTYAGGSTANITSQVSWSSSNPAVVTISASGLATGVAVGTANITASFGGITSNSVTLSVTQPALQSIAISAATSSVVKGNTDQFTATGTYADGSTANITGQVSWSSSNPVVATINASGLATGVAIGTANITASLGSITSNSIALIVNLPGLQSIAISAPQSSFVKGSSEQFTATATYSDGTTANISSQVTWISTVPTTVSISSTGLATAVASGTASISASLSGLTSNSFAITVTVPATTLQSIAISAPQSSLTKGSSEQFTATATYSDGSTANVSSQVTWTSSAPTVVSITSSGLATASDVGTANIQATLATLISNSFALSVTQPSGPVVSGFKVVFGSESYSLIGSARNRLPWAITGVQVTFSEPIVTGSAASLGGVTATGVTGVGTATLTWTFAPLGNGNYTLTLAGSGAAALTNASGVGLGNGMGSTQAFRVLLSDFSDDGYVASNDMVGVSDASTGPYNIFADQNGDGVVDINDVKIVRSRLGTSLP